MAPSTAFPYEAIASKRYKSPHKEDLSFAKGDRIRVTSLAPKDDDDDDDEDEDEPDQWLVGETLDGSKTGTFPASHVQRATSDAPEAPAQPAAVSIPASGEVSAGDERSPGAIEASDAQSGLPNEGAPEPAVKVAPGKDEAMQEPTPAGQQSEDSVAPPAVQPSITGASSTEREEVAVAAVPAPERKPSSPPLAPKPSGLAARIAAFNKPQEAPPPLPKGKPGAWKRPAPTPGAPKPVLPGPPPAQQARSAGASANPSAPIPATSPPPVAVNDAGAEGQGRVNASFSAADAQSSIKMSLKERMAALQRGEDRPETGGPKPNAPPKPAPGKIGEDKRNAAMAGMGAGTAQATSPVSPTAPKASENLADDETGEPAKEEAANAVPNAASEPKEVEGDEEGREAGASAGQTNQDGEDGEEKTEEEQESERRAAIARRMAALGGRRMGGGPALFGAPAPVPKKSSGEEMPQTSGIEAAEPEPEKEMESEPVQSGKTLAVPRRAAPPRRKKSSASSNPVAEANRSETQDLKSSQDSQPASLAGQDKTVSEAGEEGAGGAGIIIVDGSKQLTDEPTDAAANEDLQQSEPAASSYGGDATSDFEPSTPISEGQLDENARRLEEFVRTPRDEVASKADLAGEEGVSKGRAVLDDDDDDGREQEHEENERAEIVAAPIPISSPPPPNAAPPRPTSTAPRPPSTRPPIPKSTLTSDDVGERLSSPAPTRAPPRRQSVAEEDESLSPAAASQPTILAAPQPRLAVPTEASDDEGDESHEEDPRGASAVSEIPSQPQSAPEPEEMTEEEEDRQRRARIAAKMARMGGQPIMGAPMPFRKQSVPPPAEPEVVQAADGPTDADEFREGAPSPPARAPSIPPMASPPPIPKTTSPPPIPTPTTPPFPSRSPAPPTQAASSLEKRLSQMSTSDDQSLARRASLLSRPPVPSVSHSRDVSKEEGPEMDEQDEQADEVDVPRTISPPPPRAPPRAPPRQPSVAEETETLAAPVEGTPPKQQQQQQQPQQRSSRDLDLMPSSQWWRHGIPVKLPPTLLRPDAVPIVSTQYQGSEHTIRVELIFEDYSSTVVEVHYLDDDAREEATQLIQKHHFAPPRPSTEQLQSWSQRFGLQVAKQAVSALNAKTPAVGDGTSRGFILSLVAALGTHDVLPAVGSSFGSIVLAQAATTPVDVGADEIRTGDIIALHGVDFKGKKGLTPYHTTFGSAQEPTYACIIESEAKKRKLRCILVPGVEAKRGKGAEEVSLRLDDVKSGLLRVFRLAPKTGWLAV